VTEEGNEEQGANPEQNDCKKIETKRLQRRHTKIPPYYIEHDCIYLVPHLAGDLFNGAKDKGGGVWQHNVNAALALPHAVNPALQLLLIPHVHLGKEHGQAYVKAVGAWVAALAQGRGGGPMAVPGPDHNRSRLETSTHRRRQEAAQWRRPPLHCARRNARVPPPWQRPEAWKRKNNSGHSGRH
jgi:hypothetical protein